MERIAFKIIVLLNILFLIGCSKDKDNDTNGGDTPDDDPVVVVDDDPQVGVIEFVKTLGGSNNESARAVVSTQDGGYAVLGYTQSMDGDVVNKTDDSFDFWLIKFSASDVIQWKRTYGGTADDRGFDLVNTQDGGFIVTGRTNSIDGDITENAGFEDFWALKINAGGDIAWQKTFGFQGSDVGFSVIETNEGGFLFLGVLDVTASGGEGDTGLLPSSRHAGGDYWVVKVDVRGETQWTKYFGGSFTDTAEGVVQTADDGYLIVGWSDSTDFDINNNIGSYDFWVVKINSLGVLEWEKNYGGSEIDEAFGITASGDGNYLISGSIRSNDIDATQNNGGADFWLIKISPAGDLIWQKNYGGSEFDVAKSVFETQDDGFILAGSSRSQDGNVTLNEGQNDGWVIKVDADGNLKWQVSAGGSNIDFLYDAVELNDGTIIAVGDTFSNDGAIQENKGFSDLLIVKIEKD